MILCADIGNTSIKFGVVANREILDSVEVRSDATTAEIERALVRVMEFYVEAGALSSVNPRLTKSVADAIRRVSGIRPLVVTSRTKMPIRIATRRPSRVGIDRLCAACGALTERKRNAIIVDVGSAITVDLVLNRRFLGGLIMAGPQMALSALHEFTAQLPDLELAGHRKAAIDDTRAAMLTGAVVGAAGAVRAGVDLLERQAGRSAVPVWVTGGYAAHLRKGLPRRYKYVPGLTLLGLAEMVQHHQWDRLTRSIIKA